MKTMHRRACLRCQTSPGSFTLSNLCRPCHDAGLEAMDAEIEERLAGFDPRGPTPAHPGTGEKIAVLALRLEHNLPLWHPLDGRISRDSRQLAP